MKRYNHFKNIVVESISQESRLENIDETKTYFLKEIESKIKWWVKNKKRFLNYIENFLILASSITGCVSISVFNFLLGILIGIKSSVIGLKFCARTAGIKKWKWIIKKNKKKHDKIIFLAKSKLNSTEALISKILLDSKISHDKFVLKYNVLKKYDYMKEKNQIF